MTIKSSELRIGNVVNNIAGHPFAVSAENILDLFQTEQRNKIHLDFNRIEVTPEWLPKLGFHNDFDDLPEDVDVLLFIDDENDISVEIIPDKLGLSNKYIVSFYESIVDKDGNFGVQPSYEIEFDNLYVHQLQNIYFVLKGKELTINLF